MPEFLLRLMGVPGSDVTQVTDATLSLRSGGALGWLILLGAALVMLAVWVYRRYSRDLSQFQRIGLTTLRCIFLGLLVLLLMQPVLSLTIEGSIRRALVFMVDASSSMDIQDERRGDDLIRAGIALGRLDATRGIEQSAEGLSDVGRPPRMRLVRSMLQNDRLRLLPQLAEEYDIRPYRFGASAEEIAATGDTAAATGRWIESIAAEDSATRIGDGVREVLGRSRGQPLAGIVLITDGASNSGAPATAAAETARQQGVPLYIWGVGITSPRQVAVTNMFAPEVAFFDDDVPVTVRIRSNGMEGRKTRLRLELIPDQPEGASAEQKLEKEITLDDGEQIIPLVITPGKPANGQDARQYRLVASVEATGDESITDNLSRSQPLRVIDGSIKVLYVERAPRWEYRYLQAMLMRDRRVSLKTVLLEAAPGLSSDPDGPYLPEIPRDKEELFAYDLIIIGDVNLRALPSAQLDAIEEFVSKFGGGVLVIPGRRYGLSEMEGTVLERMLPVETARQSTGRSGSNGSGGAIKVELTTDGAQSTFLRLSDDETESASLWTQMPEIYWTTQVSRAKPAAQVLLTEAQTGRGGSGPRMPIFALHQYGLGQVFFSGTDQTWRWRRLGDEHYITLWTQIVRRLALPHLLGESKRTQLSTDQQEYATGDRITIYARLYDENYAPLTLDQVQATYRSPSGVEGTLLLRREQAGTYRGEFVAPQAGAYELHVENDPDTTLGFDVGAPRLELSQTAMNEPLLQQMAAVSGGQYYREETLHELPGHVRQRTERVRSNHDVDLWASPLFFILMLSVVTAEWLWRKAVQLK